MNGDATTLCDWEVCAIAPQTAPFEALPTSWRAAQVPGIASQSLPEIAEHVDDYEIWYRCAWPQDYRVSYLLCEGLAGLVEVYADQQLLLHSASMFIRYQLSLNPFATTPQYLYLRCLPLNAFLTDKKPRPRWKTRLVSQQGWRWQRQSLLGRLPGWSATHAPVGPFRELRLVAAQTLTCLDWQVSCKLDGQQGIITLHAQIALAETSTPFTLGNWQFHLHSATKSSQLRCELLQRNDGIALVVQGELRIDQVALWWPHSHGQAARYPLKLVLTENAQTSWAHDLGHCAFRQLSWQDEREFALIINQQKVFCRGVCWTPLPGLSDDVVTLRQMLELVRAAGMNMLRVPGTMLFESRNFYALCDELGIMVWQDCPFANLDYPLHDADFAAQVKQEISEFLRHQRHFASLLIVCGNSEIEQQAAMLGQPRENWRHRFFQQDLPALLHELHPACYYTPSSPATTSPDAWPFQVNAGFSHYFGVGAYLRPLTDARYADVKFTSECLGFSNLPEEGFLEQHFHPDQLCSHHPDWKRGIPRDQGCHWDFEDVRDFYLEQIFQVSAVQLRRIDNFRYRQLSRVSSGIAMAHCLQEWRRQASSCQGALLWFWRDLIPGAGWGLLDANGTPKAAYYFVKRAMQSQAIFISDEGLNGLQCHLINDSDRELAATLIFKVWHNNGQLLHQTEQALCLPPHSQQSRNDAELCPQFMDISYAYRFGAAQHLVVQAALYTQTASAELISQSLFLPQGWSKLPMHTAPQWQIRWLAQADSTTSWLLQLECDQLALAVAIDVPGFLVDDNYFDILPDQPRLVRLQACANTADAPHCLPRGQLQALNASHSVRLPAPEPWQGEA